MPVHVEFTGDEMQLIRSLQRTIAEQDKMVQGLRRVVQESKHVESGHKSAFGSTAVSQLKSYITTLVGVGAAANAIRTAFQEARAAQKEMAAELARTEDPLKRLRLVSTGPEDYARLVNQAERIAVQQGFPGGLAGAADFLVAVKNRGFTEAEAGYLSAGSRVANMTLVTDAIADLREAFGAERLGTTQEVLNQLQAAARLSALDIENIGSAAAKAAPAIAQVGGDLTELLTLISLAPSKAAGGAEHTATQLTALSKVLQTGVEHETGRKMRDEVSGALVPEKVRIAFKQRGLLSGLHEFRERYPGRFEEAILGEIRASSGYSILRANAAKLGPAAEEIRAAVTALPFDALVQTAIQDPVARSHVELRAAQASRQVAGQEIGRQETLFQVARTRLVESYERAGMGTAGAFNARLADALSVFLGPERTAGIIDYALTRRPGDRKAIAGGAVGGSGKTLEELTAENNRLVEQELRIQEQILQRQGVYSLR